MAHSLFLKPIKVSKNIALKFDKKMDGAISFFFRHWGKSKFMIQMSKKAQMMGLENLFNKGPKAV